MSKILLTGGGTAGHVTPNLALIPKLKELGYDILYIGSYNGIERKMVEDEHINYHGISSGKLRRYFDPKNFTDPFKVLKGYMEARRIIKSYQPDIVFSKGGFVTVPVVYAAKKHKIPIIIHESDLTPGLANRLSIPSASIVCHNFPETQNYLPEGKSVLTGTPIRKELFLGDRLEGLKLCGFTANKPVLMIIGGSLGSAIINENVRKALPEILRDFQIVHICGKGKLDEHLGNLTGYKQFEFVKEELKHLYALCDMVISRAGANVLCELLALKKPNILIPLSANASRGDQILNANSFEKLGYSFVLKEEDLTPVRLTESIDYLYKNKDKYKNAFLANQEENSIEKIIHIIEEKKRKRQ